MDLIHCRRCGEEKPRLERAPFRDERGERIRSSICSACWSDWLKHQTLLINHYGLDPRDAKSREFLYSQVDQVLLGGGADEQVDPSEHGTIEW